VEEELLVGVPAHHERISMFVFLVLQTAILVRFVEAKTPAKPFCALKYVVCHAKKRENRTKRDDKIVIREDHIVSDNKKKVIEVDNIVSDNNKKVIEENNIVVRNH